MNLNYSDEELEFQKEVKRFINANLSDELKYKLSNGGHPDKEETIKWQKALFEKGWIAPSWSKVYGGCEWSPTKRYIFEPSKLSLNVMTQHSIIFFIFNMVDSISSDPIL